MLRAFNVAHVLNFWERMPNIGDQSRIPGVFTANFAVLRLLIPPGERYADKKAEYAPFDRIVSPEPALHDDVAAGIEATRDLGGDTFVIVNNKVEGSSPLTVQRIAERVTASAT